MSISVIIPTIGRVTLAESIASVYPQLEHGDEIVVVSDGNDPTVASLCDMPRVHYLFTRPTANYGASQRDLGIMFAKGSHVAFLDDDDIYEPDALAQMRMAIWEDPAVAHIFRMRYGENSHQPGLVLWREPEVIMCNVGTPMYLVPVQVAKATPWSQFDQDKDFHDFHWITAIKEKIGTKFHEGVVATIRPK